MKGKKGKGKGSSKSTNSSGKRRLRPPRAVGSVGMDGSKSSSSKNGSSTQHH
jgi:hypothetical protein